MLRHEWSFSLQTFYLNGINKTLNDCRMKNVFTRRKNINVGLFLGANRSAFALLSKAASSCERLFTYPKLRNDPYFNENLVRSDLTFLRDKLYK